MQDRRLGFRVPYEAMVTSYVRDRPIKALTADLSDTGVSMSAVNLLAPPPGTRLGLELQLPGVDDSIWAAGEVCYRRGAALASGLGIRFVAMARGHARLLRDYCVETRRSQLGALLARVRA